MNSPTTIPSSSNKKPKFNQQNDDRISNLPEPILTHILSFLDTKQSIQSSILSNTWRSLWKNLTSFEFDPKMMDANKVKFVDTVTEVLKKCKPLQLQYFRLYCEFGRISSNSGMTMLFSLLEKFKVKHLDLKQPAYCLSSIPTLNDLAVFKLNLGMTNLHCWSLDNCMWLPSLETLHFQSVSFLDGTAFFEMFFSKCPLLSKLIITDCAFYSEEHVVISSASLKHFEIRSIYGYYPNIQRKKKPCKVTICTPNVISFKCRSDVANKFVFKDFSSLKDAEIDMKASHASQLMKEQKKIFSTQMVKLLEGLCNAESVTVSGLFITVIAQDIEDFATPFHALRHLKMKTWLTRDTIKVIRCLLHHCDKLETLSLEVIALEVDLGIKRPVFFADWKFSHLRVLKIKGIQGFEEEVDFLKGVLKSATNLEELIVFKRKDPLAGSEKQLEDMSDTLLALPREASSVKIRIC